MALATEIYPHLAAIPVRKTVTFTGAANLGAVGAVPIFDVTGEVLVLSITAMCTVDLTEAAPTATLALGITGSTSLFIGATNPATGIDVNEFWVSTTPTAAGIAQPAATLNIAIAANIIGTVGAQAINGGAIEFTVWYRPISSDGVIAAAA